MQHIFLFQHPENEKEVFNRLCEVIVKKIQGHIKEILTKIAINFYLFYLQNILRIFISES